MSDLLNTPAARDWVTDGRGYPMSPVLPTWRVMQRLPPLSLLSPGQDTGQQAINGQFLS
jgi:hypothetical protein